MTKKDMVEIFQLKHAYNLLLFFPSAFGTAAKYKGNVNFCLMIFNGISTDFKKAYKFYLMFVEFGIIVLTLGKEVQWAGLKLRRLCGHLPGKVTRG